MTLEKKLRKLSEIWFGNAEDTLGTEAELEQFVLCSGMTGTEDLRNSYDKVKMSGGKYRKAVAIKYIHLFFRPTSKMKRDYSILNKLPCLYPLMLICWHTGNCIHRRELIAEVISKNKQNKDKEKKLMQLIGFWGCREDFLCTVLYL